MKQYCYFATLKNNYRLHQIQKSSALHFLTIILQMKLLVELNKITNNRLQVK